MNSRTYAILSVSALLVTGCVVPGASTTATSFTANVGNQPTADVQSTGTWSTVDSYQLVSGQNSAAQMLGTSAANQVMTVGSGRDGSGNTHWLARATSDGGATWGTTDSYIDTDDYSVAQGGVLSGSDAYTVGLSRNGSGYTVWTTRVSSGAAFSVSDTYQYPSSTGTAEAFGAGVDGSGNIYAVGYAADSSAVQHWIVRQYNGSSWSTVDDYICADVSGGTSAGAFSIVASGSTVYVGGRCHDGSGNLYWAIRKSTNAGSTWATASVFEEGSASNNGAHLAIDPTTGYLYAAGGNNGSMILLRSVDAGSTWTSVDSFNLGGSIDTEAKSVFVSSTGIVYVAGAVYDGSNIHWVVRSNISSSYATLDQYSLASGQNAQAMGVVVDASNNVYVSGIATDSSAVQHWVTRKYLTN